MARIDDDRNIWLATVRPNGRPHLTPIWYCFHDRRFWICTGADTVKTRNVRLNPNVSVSLEDGSRPLVAEGTVTVHQRPYPQPVIDAFILKYDWDISRRDDPDGTFDALLEVAVHRWLMGDATT